MKDRITFRIPQDLKESIEKRLKQDNISLSNFLRKAVEHFLICKKAEETPSLKLIITKYKGKCSKCGREVSVGEWVLWGRSSHGSILICDDCMPVGSDKKLLNRHLKAREMEMLLKALKKEVEKYTRKLEDVRIMNKIEELFKTASEYHKSLMEYMRGYYPKDEEKQIIERMINTERELIRVIRDIDSFLASRIKPIKKKIY